MMRGREMPRGIEELENGLGNLCCREVNKNLNLLNFVKWSKKHV
jgi:hypothetical protein